MYSGISVPCRLAVGVASWRPPKHSKHGLVSLDVKSIKLIDSKLLYAASRSGKESEPWELSPSSVGFTLMQKVAWSCASFGPITLVNLSRIVVRSLAYICCNSTLIEMSNTPLSHSRNCCTRYANKLPPSIRARLTSDRPLQTGHSPLRLLLIVSQSKQETAFQRWRTIVS